MTALPHPDEMTDDEIIEWFNKQPHKRNKFNARKVKADGYTFDSGAEYRRYCELKLLLGAGEISELDVYPKFELQPKFKDHTGKTEKAITYKADFGYLENGVCVVEDVKGGKATQTPRFRVIVRLFKFKFRDIDFRIVEM